MARKTKRQLEIDKQKELIAETKAVLGRWSKLPFHESPLSRDSIKLLLDVIKEHDKNPGMTLAQAFKTHKLKGSEGHPHDFNLNRVEMIVEAKDDDRSWTWIAENLGGKYGLPTDKKEIQRLYDTYGEDARIRAWAREITLDLDGAIEADDD